MEKGVVFDISRFRVDDGPGVRTAVFLKGCPLRCLWCHNPESNRCQKELAYDETKCVSCHACEMVCPKNCHTFTKDGTHLVDRTSCIACGKCEKICNYEALRIYGQEMDVESVMKKVRRDKAFYSHSGGGLTVSGGEPLMQADFSKQLLKAACDEGIHTCMETSGFASKEVFQRVVKYADCLLFDYKATGSSLHKKLTGVNNEGILDNLKLADDMGIPVILRAPIIPECNDKREHLGAIGKLADTLKNIKYVEIMPYHPLGLSKAKTLGRIPGYTNTQFPEEQMIKQWLSIVKENTNHEVRSSTQN